MKADKEPTFAILIFRAVSDDFKRAKDLAAGLNINGKRVMQTLNYLRGFPRSDGR